MTDGEFDELRKELVRDFLRTVRVEEQLDYLPTATVDAISEPDVARLKQRWAKELGKALQGFWKSRKMKGLSLDAEQILAEWKTKCKRKRANRKDQFTRRQRVIEVYGGKCERCQETRWEFLSIDHIAGGGKEERQLHGDGDNLLRYLRKHEYPDGYRVLCYNCNNSLAKYGYCPPNIT